MALAAPNPGRLLESEIPDFRPTLADAIRVSKSLGDVPPERILLKPFPGSASESDVLALSEAPGKRLCELLDGTLVEKSMGFTESVIAQTIARILGTYVAGRRLGVVSGSDGTVRLFPGLVLIPDVAFVEWARLPDRRVPDDPLPNVAPNLAIEVLSRSNTVREMERKRREYFAHGVEAVWQVDPKSREVSIYSDPESCNVVGIAGAARGVGVLRDFEISVAAIFEGLEDANP